ncbi:MAG: glycoside hydrolase family 9 protein [Fimbriimonas sp.]|nr:glycoside hydrolase family 9 protein [Fimbriimonas sp.]
MKTYETLSARSGRFAWLVLALTATSAIGADTPHAKPIPNDYSNSILTRWLAKKVYATKLLDDCESLSTWSVENVGHATAKVSLNAERCKDGTHSLRFVCPTTGPVAQPDDRYYGQGLAVRNVGGANWSAWNRLSFWIYTDMPGFRHPSMIVTLMNDGVEKVPDVYKKMGVNYVLLKNHEWNHVVWEVGNLPRDKVTSIRFAYQMQGSEPGATTMAKFDIDKIELQKVDADQYEGWNVERGRIAYSHAGYPVGASKSALASDLKAKTFEVVDARSGAQILAKPVRQADGPLGRFQVMDFTDLTKPGTYILRTGDRSTQPFRIGDDVWESSLTKAINFFYAQRCGYAVPGVHDLCHADWFMEHNGQRISLAGGWHDAGDLSQNLQNTAESAYAMFALAERLQATGENPKLLATLLDEAKWGLEFVLRTTFHDGFRTSFNMMDRWTDGVVGTIDDIHARAGKGLTIDFQCAAVEALAARVLRKSDPSLAAQCVKLAEEDWRFGVDMLDHQNSTARNRWMSQTEECGHAALASLELWRATKAQTYADKAAAYAKVIVDSQEQAVLPDLHVPIAGYFYTGPDRKDVLRYEHLSNEQVPVVALAQMCSAFPKHPDWMRWYSATTLYSRYFQQAMAQFTEPYGMLGASIFADDEYERSGGSQAQRESYRRQVLNGVKVGDHHYVRRFPVWFEFRGNFGTTLSQAVGLANAAHLRGDYELSALLLKHLEWVIGRNPFAQSTMWGEGHDYAPQYTAMSGDIVGSLPVGIQTHRDGDAPYWPTENCHNWKEVWVIPTGRWIWLMKDLSGPGRISGEAKPGQRITFKQLETGKTTRVTSSREGAYNATLTAGAYEIAAGKERRTVTVLPGAPVWSDVRSGHGFDLRLTEATSPTGEITIEAKVQGTGRHTIAIRSQNATFPHPNQEFVLDGKSTTILWHGHVDVLNGPWVAVAIPDGNIDQRREVTGLAWRSR